MSVEFVDTNVVVYAHDSSAGVKSEAANALMMRLLEERSGRLSVQVLEEFYWTVTRKVPKPLTNRRALEIVEDLAIWPVYEPGAADVIRAAEMGIRHRLSFWDAMIITAAIGCGAEILWSEDLSHGARYDTLTIRNPFA